MLLCLGKEIVENVLFWTVSPKPFGTKCGVTKNITTSTLVAYCPGAVLLCVDDDPWVLGITKMVLASYGFSVLTAAGGHEALEVFLGNRVDLVLVDYAMADMNGHEVALKIKQLDPHLPVVLRSSAAKVPKAPTRAIDAFFLKGADTHILATVIAGLIINYRNNGHGMGAWAAQSNSIQ